MVIVRSGMKASGNLREVRGIRFLFRSYSREFSIAIERHTILSIYRNESELDYPVMDLMLRRLCYIILTLNPVDPLFDPGHV